MRTASGTSEGEPVASHATEGGAPPRRLADTAREGRAPKVPGGLPPGVPMGILGRAAALTAGLLVLGASVAEAQSCAALDLPAVQGIAPDPASVRSLQEVLRAAYPEAADAGGFTFVDGLLGTRTLTLTRRFCGDLGLDDTPDPAPLVALGARAFREAVAAHPEWRTQVAEPGFLAWAAGLPPGPQAPHYRLGPGGAVAPTSALLLDVYLRRGGLGASPGDVFRITDEVLAALATPPQTVQYRLTTASLARLRALGAPAFLVDAAGALRDLPVGSPEETEAQLRSLVDLLGAAPPAAPETGPDPTPPDTTPPPPAPDAAPAPTPPLPPAAAPSPPALTEAALRGAVDFEVVEPEAALRGAPIPAEVLAGLHALRGVLFPDAHLFLQALRIEAGVGASRPELQTRILAAARVVSPDPADRALQVLPIAWDGICGCGTFVKDSDEYPLYSYGIYPLWRAPQEGIGADDGAGAAQDVDFSMLTRVGYHGVTFDAEGAIRDPLHWRTGRHPEDAPFWRRSHFDRFVVTAHRHQTMVDLVLTKGDWDGWLPPPGASAADSAALRERNRIALERLTEASTGLITPTLDDLVDRIRPVISLGQSGRRTLGDGITLDLDVEGLSAPDQAWLLQTMRDGLFPVLRERLDRRGRAGWILNLGQDYSLNLIVPGYCLSDAWPESAGPGCTFYSPQAMAAFEPWFDLILVDLSREPPTPGAWDSGPSSLERARGLQRWLDRLPLDTQIGLRGKVLPLVVTGAEDHVFDEMESVFLYAGWNFSGAGLWSVPVLPEVNRSLEAAMRPEARPLGGPLVWQTVRDPVIALGLEGRVCDFVCPNRWLVRTAVAAALFLMLVLWLATGWWYGLKSIWESPWVPFAVIAVGLALVATLWCDPFWSERKSGILLFTLGGLLVVSLFSWYRKRREREYP
jgi:hypothetical protein